MKTGLALNGGTQNDDSQVDPKALGRFDFCFHGRNRGSVRGVLHLPKHQPELDIVKRGAKLSKLMAALCVGAFVVGFGAAIVALSNPNYMVHGAFALAVADLVVLFA